MHRTPWLGIEQGYRACVPPGLPTPPVRPIPPSPVTAARRRPSGSGLVAAAAAAAEVDGISWHRARARPASRQCVPSFPGSEALAVRQRPPAACCPPYLRPHNRHAYTLRIKWAGGLNAPGVVNHELQLPLKSSTASGAGRGCVRAERSAWAAQQVMCEQTGFPAHAGRHRPNVTSRKHTVWRFCWTYWIFFLYAHACVPSPCSLW